jgi:cell wall-associated NlpC family hydrolase
MLCKPNKRWHRTLCAGASWLALGVSLTLGGCAGPGFQTTGPSFALDVNESMAEDHDPIGRLIAQQLKGDRPAPPLVREALKNLGIPYRFGGISPNTGFDCSGLVAYCAAKALNLTLPHNAVEISERGTFVDKNALKVGDLVFFNTLGRPYSHVGIYLGNQRFVHSSSTGGAVRVENMNMAYWRKHYNGARRLDNKLIAGPHVAH